MKGSASLKAQIAAFAQKNEARFDALARQSVQALAHGVVEDTPLDTGFLRGSWQPSIGEPSMTHKGEMDASGGLITAKLASIIPQIKTGVIFHMMNNAAYAGYVHDGTTTMAARPWVQNKVAAWPSIVRDVINDLKG
jgi:hypothetical protein